MISVGLDIGSVAAKGVMLAGNNKFQAVLPTGWSPREAGKNIVKTLLDISGFSRSDIDRIVVTGYGRVALTEAYKAVTEITCHARGIAELYPEVRTIIDIGGQDSKVIRINEKGRVIDFAMNDKCAAGTGRFLQVMANTLGLDVSELAENEDQSQITAINSMCTVFAESEIVSLMARGVSKGGIIAGIHQSVARRVAGMVKRVGLQEKVAFTGGVALNAGVRNALRRELGIDIIVPEVCQFTGALGAALLAREA
ncbi:CoA-substrate-specific enzyme activase, putative [Thermosyntropha lipolytica DSM 11003]|uniref:CoA-substrate-specific enzyme activase, putative n=1 Tax=Thermosyntropha lipolytica DSM 11003 TaxID=1123382 RepID=A0A1M5RS01_9FIRM|nr:acyl-CoA dehydratase activase [Thermosyntropha lipolytica]SHH28980.1 CoA-substrate-specific enzyme activase, putative [Thermosyntropha lipolytica DSM 11003]